MPTAALSRAPAIHSFVRQSVGIHIVLAECMTNLKVFELADQSLRFFIELAQLRMLNLIDALHLADHEFRITDYLERPDAMRVRITQDAEQSLILRVVVGVVPEIFAEFGDLFAGRGLDDHAIARRTRIAAGAAVDMGSVSGAGTARRCGKEFTRVGGR